MLAKCPTQAQLQRASPQQLARWLPKKRRVADDPPAEVLAAERIGALRAAPPLVTDRAVLEGGRLMVRHLVAVLQQLNEAVAEYDARIAAALAEHPEATLFAELPGAGPALTPRLVAAFGTDRQRYASAAELQQLSGVAPITKRSGKSYIIQMRRACPKALRQTFHEFARCSIGKSEWATGYYAMLRKKGHGFHAAVRALAFKWIRVLYACWRNRQPYDEARHFRQLRANTSPLLAFLPAAKQT